MHQLPPIHYPSSFIIHSTSICHVSIFLHLYIKPCIYHTALTIYHPSTISPPSSPSPFTSHASIFWDVAICHLIIIHSSPNHPFRIHPFIIFSSLTFPLHSHSTQTTFHWPSNHSFAIYAPFNPSYIIHEQSLQHTSIQIYLPFIHPLSMDRSITIIHLLFICHPSMLP